MSDDNEDKGQLAVRRAGMEHKGDFKPVANLLTQLARGWLAGTAGLPGDLEGLARTVNKYTSLNPAVRAQDTTPLLPTSEFYKEWLPGKDEGVGGKELNDLASLFGGAGSTTLARGGVKAGKGALTLADAAARNAAVPRTLSAQAGVIKAPGGNWLSGSVEDALRGLKRSEGNMARQMEAVHGQRIAPIPEADQADALNSWIDKQLTRYVKNDMATERDPIRALAERGISHSRIMNTPYSEMADVHAARKAAGLPDNGLAKSLDARLWEKASDSMLRQKSADAYTVPTKGPRTGLTVPSAEMLANPWLAKVDPTAPVFTVKDNGLSVNLGFDHLLDELRNATNPASGLPRELQIDPKSLDRLSVPQAVERVAKINQWREAQKIEASQALANNPATHLFKEYTENNPKGLKWVELKQPAEKGPLTTVAREMGPGQVPEAASLQLQARARAQAIAEGIDPAAPEFDDAVNDILVELETEWLPRNPMVANKHLADALKYEGDTMGHCVGGYCEDVASGASRIFSLRDKKGQPHVTIEVKPKETIEFYQWLAEQKDPKAYKDFTDWWSANTEAGQLGDLNSAFARWTKEKGITVQEYAPNIIQIKGKGNKKPNDEYLPFVQDFVKSGKWSSVGDLQNTGLVKHSGKRAEKLGAYSTEKELTDYLDQFPDTTGYASGGSVSPYAIDAAAFHSAVDPLLGDGSSWQAHDDSPEKLALQLGNGKTWNVAGGDNNYGSGVYKYDPATQADDDKYAEALALYQATGLAQYNPDNIAVGTGSKADRDNMLESWIGSGGATGALRDKARGYDTGESGRVEGTPYTQEEWAAALKQDAPSYDPTQALYRVRGDMSEMLGKPDSRMFMDAGYQEHDGQMNVVGKPSKTYQKSAGAENIAGLSALIAAYTLGGSLGAQQAASGGAAMAEAAQAANAANAAQGFGNLGVPVAQSVGQQAMSVYQAAQPYLRAVNTVGSLASGNPMGAVMGYVPGVDLGLGELGNSVANSAVRAGLSGGDPLMGAVTGAVGNVIPADLKQYLPMANALVSASKGGLTLQNALQMVDAYTKQGGATHGRRTG